VGAPRIHGELLKLGVEISQATVGRYMPWRPKVPSPTWRSFLHNHLTDVASIDMFVVATVTFRLLFALIVLGLDRRRVIYFDVTQNPKQAWLSQQMTEAFPRGHCAPLSAPGSGQIVWSGISQSCSGDGHHGDHHPPRSPWQNPYIERLFGWIRRECLDHTIVFNERHLRRVLSSYFQYHHDTRTHLSLDKDCPRPHSVQPPSVGNVIAFPEVGGLHHRYERRAA